MRLRCEPDGAGGIIIKHCTSDSDTITIPADISGRPITQISSSAFVDVPNLKKLIIKSKSIIIHKRAFKNSRIEQIIANDISLIGEEAFSNSSLKNIEANSIGNVLQGAFEKCTQFYDSPAINRIQNFGGDVFNAQGVFAAKCKRCTPLANFCNEYNYTLIEEGDSNG